MKLKIYQVDAFTERLFGGNPAAVVPLQQFLPDETMQAIAAENNLAETAYIVRKGKGSYDLRWFTPAIEVDLCGHATLATAHVLWSELGANSEVLEFHTRSGKLSVQQAGDFYQMDFPTDKLTRSEAPAAMLEALGVKPVEVFYGREDYLVVLENQELVEQLSPDFRKLKDLKGRGSIVTAPGREVDFVSRCFFPNAGIDEDPVTGSAHTTLTPYWAERLKKSELTARQISQRGGFLKCHLRGERTLLFGKAVTYLKGSIAI